MSQAGLTALENTDHTTNAWLREPSVFSREFP
jgi:hypothetical protein